MQVVAKVAGQLEQMGYVTTPECIVAAEPIDETPKPIDVTGNWRPPGIGCPWPRDEYLGDGGDAAPEVLVSPDWDVYGLGLEDTVAHYDALDGRTIVKPSNHVCIYAPKFGAVRVVSHLAEDAQLAKAGGMAAPQRLSRHDDVKVATTGLQRVQLGLQGAARPAEAFAARQGDDKLASALKPLAFQDSFLPFENLQIIRVGVHDGSEKARLAQATEAAIAWTGVQAVQVVLDELPAVVLTSDQRSQVTYSVKPEGSPCLRVIKVASSQTALPGETIDFTIRFDNTGNQPIGNIVLMDNLTTRLEYVPDSAQSSVKATFRTDPNQGESSVLRWEISDPLAPGEGGIVRFRCRVR